LGRLRAFRLRRKTLWSRVPSAREKSACEVPQFKTTLRFRCMNCVQACREQLCVPSKRAALAQDATQTQDRLSNCLKNKQKTLPYIMQQTPPNLQPNFSVEFSQSAFLCHTSFKPISSHHQIYSLTSLLSFLKVQFFVTRVSDQYRGASHCSIFRVKKTHALTSKKFPKPTQLHFGRHKNNTVWSLKPIQKTTFIERKKCFV
jgi:hypothetical protein